MSNYQTPQALAIELHSGALKLPQDAMWWDHFIEFIQERHDAQLEDVQRARSGLLPRIFYPKDGSCTTPESDGLDVLAGEYWMSILMDYEYFWTGLWEAGNRGKVVVEFQSEGSFNYEGRPYNEEDPFAIHGDGGGFYVVCVYLEDEGPRRVLCYDDESFYVAIEEHYDMALEEALEAEGVESEDELEDGYFEWSVRDAIDELNIYQRYTLLYFPEEGFEVLESDFS